MEFKTDKTYSFPKLMAYGFFKDEGIIYADCHLYLGENSFDAMIDISEDTFRHLITHSDDKSGIFEKACAEWLDSGGDEIFMPDLFPEPVHCKLPPVEFTFEKSEIEEDDFDPERVFYFSEAVK